MAELNSRELATVLAALRFWQRSLVASDENVAWTERVMPDFFPAETRLTSIEIDTLCERLNTPDRTSVLNERELDTVLVSLKFWLFLLRGRVSQDMVNLLSAAQPSEATTSAALTGAGSRSGTMALSAGELEELADRLYALVYSTRVEITTPAPAPARAAADMPVARSKIRRLLKNVRNADDQSDELVAGLAELGVRLQLTGR